MLLEHFFRMLLKHCWNTVQQKVKSRLLPAIGPCKFDSYHHDPMVYFRVFNEYKSAKNFSRFSARSKRSWAEVESTSRGAMCVEIDALLPCTQLHICNDVLLQFRILIRILAGHRDVTPCPWNLVGHFFYWWCEEVPKQWINSSNSKLEATGREDASTPRADPNNSGAPNSSQLQQTLVPQFALEAVRIII